MEAFSSRKTRKGNGWKTRQREIMNKKGPYFSHRAGNFFVWSMRERERENWEQKWETKIIAFCSLSALESFSIRPSVVSCWLFSFTFFGIYHFSFSYKMDLFVVARYFQLFKEAAVLYLLWNLNAYSQDYSYWIGPLAANPWQIFISNLFCWSEP